MRHLQHPTTVSDEEPPTLTSLSAYRESYKIFTIPNELRHFLMGICQRNGSAHQLWPIISSIVFSALLTQGFGIHFVNSFTTKILQLVGLIYVNACDMIQSDDDIKSTHSKVQLTISEWEDLIIITGGWLELDKIMWYIFDYKWIQGKWKCTSLGQDQILETTNTTRKIVSLLYLKPNEAMFMLGIYLAPDGNDKYQVEFMKKKATAWETAIRSVGVQQNKAWKSLNSTIPQTIKYPLSTMTLNNK